MKNANFIIRQTVGVNVFTLFVRCCWSVGRLVLCLQRARVVLTCVFATGKIRATPNKKNACLLFNFFLNIILLKLTQRRPQKYKNEKKNHNLFIKHTP